MKNDEIQSLLKTDKPFLKDNLGAEVIALFGSKLKAVKNSKNYLDIFVELKNTYYVLQ